MTTPRDIGNYGGIFADQIPVENPTTQQSAAYANRANEDLAQLTRTTMKAVIAFTPSNTAGPVAVDPSTITVRSHFGNGTPQKPVITKTATGIYSIVFGTAFTDPLGNEETVVFTTASATVSGPTLGLAQVMSVATNQIVVNVYNSTWNLTDLLLDVVTVRAE